MKTFITILKHDKNDSISPAVIKCIFHFTTIGTNQHRWVTSCVFLS